MMSATNSKTIVTVAMVFILPIPLAILRFLIDLKKTYEREVFITIFTLMLFCFIATAFAYFNVYRIIRHHQQQVHANKTLYNFGQQPAID